MPSTNTPEFRVISINYGDVTHTPLWLKLDVRVRGQTLHLTFSSSAFDAASPTRLAELRDYALALYGPRRTPDCTDDCEEEDDPDYCTHIQALEEQAYPDDAGLPWLSGLARVDKQDEFFRWAMTPLVPLLDDIAPPQPPPGDVVTVKDYYAGRHHECSIGARDDVLILHALHTREGPCARPELAEEAALLAEGVFPVFAASETQILRSQLPALVHDPEPQAVCVAGQTYEFEPLVDSFADHASALLAKHATVARARLPSSARVRGLAGVVVDVDRRPGQVLGLLMPWKGEEYAGRMLLAHELRSRSPPSLATRRLWVRQLRETAAALHEAGVVWGCFSEWDVDVTDEDGLWLRVEYGYRMGAFRGDKFGTVEGDVQGVEALVDVIMDMSKAPVPSKM